VRTSVIQNTHINLNVASEMITYITHAQVQDQIQWVQVGQSDTIHNFFKYSVPTFMDYSYEDQFDNYYKIAGIMIYNSYNLELYQR